MNRLRGRASAVTDRLTPWLTPRLIAPISLLLAAVVGLVAGQLMTNLGNDDRLVIGNTAGTLSALLQVHDTRIAIGGGDSYADFTDLVDRSTLPWKRRVDLLVVPGWDSRNAAGALGLAERGPVAGIAVIGTKGSAPEWGNMEETARQSGATVRYLAGEHRLTLTDGVSLTFEAAGTADRTDAGAATITLDYHGAKIVMVDAAASNDTIWKQIAERGDTTHILVSLRSPAGQAGRGAQVAIQPAARHSSDLTVAAAQFTSDLDSGSRFTVRLNPGEIRIPMNRLTRTATPSQEPAATPSALGHRT